MNEKVVYSKTREGPVIKSVIRAASEEAQEKPKRKPRRESKPLPVRQQRAAKEKKEREKKKDKGKEDEQEDEQEEGEESGQDRALEKDKHDSIDVDEDQTESSTGFREDPRVTADIIVFGTDDVVSKGKTHGPLLLRFGLMGLSHGTHGTFRLIFAYFAFDLLLYKHLVCSRHRHCGIGQFNSVPECKERRIPTPSWSGGPRLCGHRHPEVQA